MAFSCRQKPRTLFEKNKRRRIGGVRPSTKKGGAFPERRRAVLSRFVLALQIPKGDEKKFFNIAPTKLNQALNGRDEPLASGACNALPADK
jgi:hypothetical protein